MAFKSNAADVNKSVKEISDNLRVMQEDMRKLSVLFTKKHLADEQAIRDEKVKSAAAEKTRAAEKVVNDLKAAQSELMKKHAPTMLAMSSALEDMGRHAAAFSTLSPGQKFAVTAGAAVTAIQGLGTAVNYASKMAFSDAAKTYTDAAIMQIRGSKMMRDNAFETMSALATAGNAMSQKVGFSAQESVKVIGTTMAALKRAGDTSATVASVGQLGEKVGNLGKTAGMGADQIADANDFLIGNMQMTSGDLGKMFEGIHKTAGIYGMDGNKGMAVVKANENLLRSFTKDQREQVAEKMMESAGMFHQAGVNMGSHIDKLGGNKTGFDAIKSAAIIASQSGVKGLSAEHVMGLMSRAKAGDASAQTEMGGLKNAAIKNTTGMDVEEIKKKQAAALGGDSKAVAEWDKIQTQLRTMEETVLPMYGMKSWDDAGQFKNDSDALAASKKRGEADALKPVVPGSTTGQGAPIESTFDERAKAVEAIVDSIKLKLSLVSEGVYTSSREARVWTDQFAEAVSEFSASVSGMAQGYAAIKSGLQGLKLLKGGGSAALTAEEAAARGGMAAAKAGAPLLPGATNAAKEASLLSRGAGIIGKGTGLLSKGANMASKIPGIGLLGKLAGPLQAAFAIGDLMSDSSAGYKTTSVASAAEWMLSAPVAAVDNTVGYAMKGVQGVLGTGVLGKGAADWGKRGWNTNGAGITGLIGASVDAVQAQSGLKKADTEGNRIFNQSMDVYAKIAEMKKNGTWRGSIDGRAVGKWAEEENNTLEKKEQAWPSPDAEKAPAEETAEPVVSAIEDQTKANNYASRDILGELKRLTAATEARGNTFLPIRQWGMAV